MEFPALPTDSLYKFVFVGGLALIILGVLLPNWALEATNEEPE